MHFQFSLPSLLLLLVSSCSPIHGRNSHITDNKVYVMNREQVVNDFTKPAQEDQHHDHLQFYKGIEREMKPINTLRILKGMENNVSRQDRKGKYMRKMIGDRCNNLNFIAMNAY